MLPFSSQTSISVNVWMEEGPASGNAKKHQEETKYIDRFSRSILFAYCAYLPDRLGEFDES